MKCIFLFLSLLAIHGTGFTQDQPSADSLRQYARTVEEKQRKPLTINFSVFNHSIATPFHKIINSPLHPGVQAGMEGRYFETSRSKLFQSLNLGMFYNRYNGTGFYLATELGYRYTSACRIFAEALTGLGYIRMYHPTDIYELNAAGDYRKVKDKGFSSSIYSFAFGLGYATRSSSAFSFAPFVRYQFFVQNHFNDDLDVLPHAAFHVGVHINKKRTR